MWRKRLQDLSRGAGLPHPPLFAPVLFGAAAAIESIAPAAMALDPTRLRKNVGELRRMLGTEVLFALAPGDGERLPTSASGTVLTPEAWGQAPLLAASLEAVRQWQVEAGEPVIAAALSGPATRVAALRAAARVDPGEPDEAVYEAVGLGLAGLARAFCEAGVHLLQWHETVLPAPDAVDHWKGALGTAGNVARFHRVAPVLVAAGLGDFGWPAQAVACPDADQKPPPPARPHGRAWPGDPADWPACAATLVPGAVPPASGADAAANGLKPGSERLVTTAGEVSPRISPADLLAAVRRLRAPQSPA